MRKKNSGFTLIELLAVIIILAIVSIISTPIILNVIDNAREGAAEDKAWGTIEAVKLKYTESALDGTNTTLPFTVTFNTNGTNSGNVKISGENPTGGTVTITAEGKLTCSGLKFDKFTCTTTNGTTMTCTRT